MNRALTSCIALIGWTTLHLGCAAKPEFSGRLKVITYNANDSAELAPDVERAIREADPDLVCVQEARISWCHSFKHRLGDRYRTARFADGGFGEIISSALMLSGERPAFFSKYAIREIGYLPRAITGTSDAMWSDVWLVEAETPAGVVKLVSVSLDSHHSNLDEIVAAVGGQSPALIMGEFGEERIDTAMAKTQRAGFTDVLPKFDPNTPTWRGWRRIWPRHAQRDHILCSQHLRPEGARVISTRASKHSPVFAEMTLIETPTTAPAVAPRLWR